MLELPHPLLPDDKNLHGRFGRAGVSDVEIRTPKEDHHNKDQRNEGPEHFEREAPFDLGGLFFFGPAPVFDGEIEYGQEDEGGEKQINRSQEIVKMIDSTRDGGGLLRPYWEPLPHSA
jgi:hypothetical protein